MHMYKLSEGRKSGLALLFVVAVLGVGFTQDAPTKMTHAIIQMSGSEITPDSFSAKPKTFWRASNRYCRIDEEPDPAKNIHGRMVINEPDAWLVNLADKSAKHLLDRGPTYNCILPIFVFDPETARSKIGELEVGKELEFFRANGAKLIEGPKLEFKADYYEMSIGNSVLRLVERTDIHAPIMVSLRRGDKLYTARYLVWDDGLPFKADLFAKPVGVTIEEMK